MARSTYIYVATSRYEPGDITAAFTVKHELVKWMRSLGNDAIGYYVTRVPDGGFPGRSVSDMTEEIWRVLGLVE